MMTAVCHELTGVVRDSAREMCPGWSCSDHHLWARLEQVQEEFVRDLKSSHLVEVAEEMSMVEEHNCLLERSIPNHESYAICYSRERLQEKKNPSKNPSNPRSLQERKIPAKTHILSWPKNTILHR